MRIIALVMGEPDSKTRNKEVSEMLDYAFAQYKINNLLKNNSLGNYEVSKSNKKYVEIIPKEQVTTLLKKTEESKATYDVKIGDLYAPIKKGDVVGKIKIKEDGKTVRTIDLTVKENVKKANIFELYFRYMKDIVFGDVDIN